MQIAKTNSSACWCRYCAAAVGPDFHLGQVSGFKYSDGRVICKTCHDSAIKTAESFEAVQQHIAQKMQAYGLTLDWSSVVLRLDHQPHFGAEGVLGLAKLTTTQLFFKSSRKSEIVILYGMPKILALETLAHEASHVFCHQHKIRFKQPQTEEGFCNLVAFKVMQDLNQIAAMEKLMRNPCPIYGGLFRGELACMQTLGWDNYLLAIRNNQR